MDEERPGPETGASAGAAAEKERNDNVGIGVVFGLLGVTLFLTLDSPWAGLPMVVIGVVCVYLGMRGSTRRRTADRRATTDD
jgi:hypothetical protein